MIVVDTSAIVAILLEEPEGTVFRDIIARDDRTLLSALSFYETALVLSTRVGKSASSELEAYLSDNDVRSIPFDEMQARIAADAYARYGKGRGSKAQLNLCDCAAYALATSLDAPLLYKGGDFSHTNVKRCV